MADIDGNDIGVRAMKSKKQYVERNHPYGRPKKGSQTKSSTPKKGLFGLVKDAVFFLPQALWSFASGSKNKQAQEEVEYDDDMTETPQKAAQSTEPVFPSTPYQSTSTFTFRSQDVTISDAEASGVGLAIPAPQSQPARATPTSVPVSTPTPPVPSTATPLKSPNGAPMFVFGSSKKSKSPGSVLSTYQPPESSTPKALNLSSATPARAVPSPAQPQVDSTLFDLSKQVYSPASQIVRPIPTTIDVLKPIMKQKAQGGGSTPTSSRPASAVPALPGSAFSPPTAVVAAPKPALFLTTSGATTTTAARSVPTPFSARSATKTAPRVAQSGLGQYSRPSGSLANRRASLATSTPRGPAALSFTPARTMTPSASRISTTTFLGAGNKRERSPQQQDQPKQKAEESEEVEQDVRTSSPPPAQSAAKRQRLEVTTPGAPLFTPRGPTTATNGPAPAIGGAVTSSETAKRILDTLDKISSPMVDLQKVSSKPMALRLRPTKPKATSGISIQPSATAPSAGALLASLAKTAPIELKPLSTSAQQAPQSEGASATTLAPLFAAAQAETTTTTTTTEQAKQPEMKFQPPTSTSSNIFAAPSTTSTSTSNNIFSVPPAPAASTPSPFSFGPSAETKESKKEDAAAKPSPFSFAVKAIEKVEEKPTVSSSIPAALSIFSKPAAPAKKEEESSDVEELSSLSEDEENGGDNESLGGSEQDQEESEGESEEEKEEEEEPQKPLMTFTFVAKPQDIMPLEGRKKEGESEEKGTSGKIKREKKHTAMHASISYAKPTQAAAKTPAEGEAAPAATTEGEKKEEPSFAEAMKSDESLQKLSEIKVPIKPLTGLFIPPVSPSTPATTATSTTSSAPLFSFAPPAPSDDKKEKESIVSPKPAFPAPATSTGFSFGAPSTTTTAEPKISFSFGAPAAADKPSAPVIAEKQEEEKKEQPAAPITFSFGAQPAADETKPSPFGGFSFGGAQPPKETEKQPEAKVETTEPQKIPGPTFNIPPGGFAFGFGGEKSEEPENAKEKETVAPVIAATFTFGVVAKPEEAKKADEKPVEAPKPLGFSFAPSPAVQAEEPKKADQSETTPSSVPAPSTPSTAPFSFGAPAQPTSAAPAASGFSFGFAPKPTETKPEEPTPAAAPVAPVFGFGAGFGSQPSPAAPVFPAPSEPVKQPEAVAPKPVESSPAPVFSFGSAPASPAPSSSSTFTFGGSQTKPADAPAAPANPFTFGAAPLGKPPLAPTSSTEQPSTSTFVFGSQPVVPKQSESPQPPSPAPFMFGSAPAPAAPKTDNNPFGAATPSVPSPAVPTTGFSFGGSTSPSPFGSATAASPSVANPFSFGAPTAPAPSAPFAFGATAPTQPSPFPPAPSGGDMGMDDDQANQNTSAFPAAPVFPQPAPALPSFGGVSSSPSFGNSTFTFGAPQATAPGSGNPSPVPPAPFNFGAAPASPSVGNPFAFSAPSPTNAPPTSASPSFNIGSAPAASGGRKIVTARRTGKK